MWPLKCRQAIAAALVELDDRVHDLVATRRAACPWRTSTRGRAGPGCRSRAACTDARSVDHRMHRRVGDDVEQPLRRRRRSMRDSADQVGAHAVESARSDRVAMVRAGMDSWPRRRARPARARRTPLRLYDTATGGSVAPDPRRTAARMYVCGITPVRRHASRARGDLPRLRPGPAGVARRRARGALRAERHRRRRPAARAGRAHRRELDGARRAGDRSCSART